MIIKLKFNKKGVMGVGMLILFISAILVAAIAAGVIVRSTGMLQQRSLEVEEAARERIVNRLEIVSIDAVGNLTTDKVMGFEFLARLGAGSYPIDINEMGFTFSSLNTSAAALYFAEDSPASCSFFGLNSTNGTILDPEVEFCFSEVFGDGNNVIKEGELVKIIYKLNDSNYLPTNEEFEVSFVPTRGAIVTLYLKTPKVINRVRTRIRA